MTQLILAFAEFALSFALSALVILLTYRGFLWLMPHMDCEEEIRKGNAAVAIMLGSLMVGSALILQQSVYPVVGILMVSMTSESLTPKEFLLMAAYSLGHLVFGFLISVGCVRLALKFFEKLTGDMDEDGEIRKGNVPIAIVLASVVLVLSMFMKEGVSAMTKTLIPQPKLGGLQLLP
jgi:uncharacterized membrane protein YjfL (UPF0719 family)